MLRSDGAALVVVMSARVNDPRCGDGTREIPRPAGESAGVREDVRVDMSAALRPTLTSERTLRSDGAALVVVMSARVNDPRCGDGTREIPRPAGESAGLRDDVIVEMSAALRPTLTSERTLRSDGAPLVVVMSARVNDPRCGDGTREIPRPAGESAGLRDDVIVEMSAALRPTLTSERTLRSDGAALVVVMSARVNDPRCGDGTREI